MRAITSRKNPIVESFRNAAKRPSSARFLLDGVHLVREAAELGLPMRVAVLDAQYRSATGAGALARRLADAGLEVVVVSPSVMAALSPAKSPQGIVALVRREEPHPLQVLDAPRALVVAPADVQDPGNVGAMIRAAEALGATGAWPCGASANPFGWKALRGSMGSALRLPVASGEDPAAVVQLARSRAMHCVAAVPRGGVPPDVVRWTGPTVLFLGGEGPGLSGDVIAACDERVTIPIAPQVESLNVAVATAVLLYEARRQRQAAPPAPRPSV